MKTQPAMGSVNQYWVIPESKLGNGGCFLRPSEGTEHVLSAQPTLELIDKLESALEIASANFKNLQCDHIHLINTARLRLHGETTPDESPKDALKEISSKVNDAITELRKWKDGLK